MRRRETICLCGVLERAGWTGASSSEEAASHTHPYVSFIRKAPHKVWRGLSERHDAPEQANADSLWAKVHSRMMHPNDTSVTDQLAGIPVLLDRRNHRRTSIWVTRNAGPSGRSWRKTEYSMSSCSTRTEYKLDSPLERCRTI